MFLPLLLSLALLGAGATGAHAADAAAAEAESAVHAFHAALRVGDVAAVQRLLAADAVILEGGVRESREEYLAHHLAADIEFAKAVPTRPRTLQARVQGEVAWVHSSSRSVGSFRKRPVDLEGAELVVLTRRGAGWEIRAIHWSARAVKSGSPPP